MISKRRFLKGETAMICAGEKDLSFARDAGFGMAALHFNGVFLYEFTFFVVRPRGRFPFEFSLAETLLG
jgi:hypothetical protein